MTSLISFARKYNADKTFDSVCTRCYQTIACSWNLDHLECAEESHVCDAYSALLLNGIDLFKHAM
jgi:hypothetical protein